MDRADNPYHEELSLAIGYAVYDPEIDHSFADTFKRADKEMYADKKQYYELHDRRK
jgi:GGDEF domain-containing protein